jgi:hypothetical protein
MPKFLLVAAAAAAAWVLMNPGQSGLSRGGGSLMTQFGLPAAGVGGAAVNLAGRVSP